MDNLSEQKTINELPKLYAKASTGKIKTWEIWVTDNEDGTATMWRRSGYIDGKLKDTPKIIKTGKNIGKSNETTPLEQAIAMAKSKHKKNLGRNYVPNQKDLNGPIKHRLPMKAQYFNKRKHDIDYPAIVQPKLNGVRCTAKNIDGKIELTSNGGKSYNETLFHLIDPILEILPNGKEQDGEIYYHGWSLQQISRRVKKVREDTHLLEFWTFDMVDTESWCVNRLETLNDMMMRSMGTQIKCLNNKMVMNEQEVYKFHDEYVQDGYEGIIIRNINGKYKFGPSRCKDLQKYKKFIDAEFKIIAAESEIVQVPDGQGGFLEVVCVIWICITEEGNTFKVRPKGTIERRAYWYQNKNQIIGKDLTVRFFEYSEDMIPQQPVGIVIRDYE
jgi:DNA ligase-1